MKKLGKREQIIAGVLVLLLLLGVVWRFSDSFSTADKSSVEYNTGEAFLDAGGETEAETLEEITETLTVHVVGAVNEAGIYDLPADSRVNDALQAAGGATADAELAQVNLARPLVDGEQVFIPDETATAGAAEGGSGEAPAGVSSGKVNINQASVSELTSLNGIGDTRAQNIITHREEHGPFNSIEDIMNVPNIASGIFEGIKDDITVY